MARTALVTLKTWYETGDKPTAAQFENLLDSFHHKDDGELINNVAQDANGIILTLTDASLVTIPIYTLPANMPVSFITGLQALIDNKVDKIIGKGLSTEDFTTALKAKLDALVNYVHPATHEVSEVNGLQAALDAKTETGGYAGSSQDLKTEIDKSLYKIGDYMVDRKGGVNTTTILQGNIMYGIGTFKNGDYIIAEALQDLPTLDSHIKIYHRYGT